MYKLFLSFGLNRNEAGGKGECRLKPGTPEFFTVSEIFPCSLFGTLRFSFRGQSRRIVAEQVEFRIGANFHTKPR
jgi:hypothetical protein